MCLNKVEGFFWEGGCLYVSQQGVLVIKFFVLVYFIWVYQSYRFEIQFGYVIVYFRRMFLF